MCSAPSFRNTAPKEPMNDPIRTRMIELAGVFHYFFTPENRYSAHNECNPDTAEEVHMLIRQNNSEKMVTQT